MTTENIKEYEKKYKDAFELTEEVIKDFEGLFNKHLKTLISMIDEQDSSFMFQGYCSAYFYSLISMVKKFGSFDSLDDLMMYFKETFMPSALSSYYAKHLIIEEKGEDHTATHDEMFDAMDKFRNKFFKRTDDA